MKRPKRRLSRLSVPDMAYAALKEAVADVMKQHKKLGLPVYVEENGKIITIPAKAIK